MGTKYFTVSSYIQKCFSGVASCVEFHRSEYTLSVNNFGVRFFRIYATVFVYDNMPSAHGNLKCSLHRHKCATCITLVNCLGISSQWSSGRTLACCARDPGFKSRCGQKFVSLRYAALGTGCTLTAVPRSTQPSTLRGTVNEYQPHG